MIFLDVCFGIFAFLPQGWLFMAFVIVAECTIVAKMLAGKWYVKKIYKVVAAANIISGLVGIITTMVLNGGWYLVVWFPWVSSHEIDIHRKGAIKMLVIFYLISFIASLVIEAIINILILKKSYTVKKVVTATILANAVTYLVGSVLLYSYSFGLV